MNIAYIVHSVSDSKGHDKYTAELIRHFYSNNKISVFASEISGIDKDKFVFHKVPCIKQPIILKVISFFILSYLVLFFKKLTKRYDIVHLQGACIIPPQRAIITAHICSAAYYNMYRKYTMKRLPWVKKIYQFIYLNLCIILEKTVFRNYKVKKIIAPSNRAKNDLIKYYKIDPGRISVVYEGVDTEKFKQNINRNYDKKTITLSLVGDYERNNLFYIIKTIKKIDNIKLIAIGNGNFRYYHKFINKLGINDRIMLLKSQKDLFSIFKICDIFICPSIYETFSLATLEAMSSGLVVLVSKFAGISELLVDNENGILLGDPADINEISQKIEYLVKNPKVFEKISNKAINTAKSYTWHKVAGKTLNIYNDIIKQYNY